MVGREDKTTNNRTMLPTLKTNAATGYQGPVKIELLKGAGLLVFATVTMGEGEWLLFIRVSKIFNLCSTSFFIVKCILGCLG